MDSVSGELCFKCFFANLTVLGNTTQVTIFTIVVVIVLGVIVKDWRLPVWSGMQVFLGAWALNQGLKYLFARPRPTDQRLIAMTGYAFPSGHAMGSVIFHGMLLYLIIYYFNHKKYRNVLLVLGGLLIFLIGISRIYLSVHYPSDVVAGFFIGGSWLLLAIWFWEVVMSPREDVRSPREDVRSARDERGASERR